MKKAIMIAVALVATLNLTSCIVAETGPRHGHGYRGHGHHHGHHRGHTTQIIVR